MRYQVNYRIKWAGKIRPEGTVIHIEGELPPAMAHLVTLLADEDLGIFSGPSDPPPFPPVPEPQESLAAPEPPAVPAPVPEPRVVPEPAPGPPAPPVKPHHGGLKKKTNKGRK